MRFALCTTRGEAAAGSGGKNVAKPALVRLPAHPRIGAVDAAGKGVLGAIIRARLDVAAVNPDRRGAEKPQSSSRIGVDDLDTPHLGVDDALRE